ncbi:DUF3224 domain-containing protein [Burkholderia ubonensis]|uniref:DUF3224 family protein n=1 Tax=Burkholderia ubonensis TaxID=101571 RepID=A0AB74D355_9BURK|nr:DUF3224 domain-containing protein [Burkholderia ubonensis]PAJ79954.1 hypothetical protein CJO71_15570 [Burkholderia ubonensis]PAJ86333.1 hypothetical protein CJO70_18240 [Burkholderia ubonensis]PAJ93252.1 hypothetical protein CJO69_17350 [Burkholderia ubonensis]PAK00378.1 hypothetical protein CJO68_14615 [Burkholderia ubonensis]PAK06752.1 hypothetical protein CJO67_17370 [Burkholderia ubonensis]
MNEQLVVVRTMLNWVEQTLSEFGDGRKMASAAVTYQCEGGFDAVSSVTYSLVYLTPSTALFSGFEAITVASGGLQGALILRHDGVFENGVATIEASVVADACSGAFAGLDAAARIEADAGNPMKSTLIIDTRRA